MFTVLHTCCKQLNQLLLCYPVHNVWCIKLLISCIYNCVVCIYSQLWQNLNSSLTASCHVFCVWPMTNVWRVVSTACHRSFTQSGNVTTRSSCLSVVLYWRRPGGQNDVTSSRRDVSDSAEMRNVSVVDSVVSHFTYEWSSADTRQIQ